MQEHGVYFGKQDIYNLIRTNGGEWNDSKERPLVCLMKSLENEHLYWAIPVGDWSHRTKEAQDRINKYLSLDEADIRSCFYHLGSTDKKSIFFISDVIPITNKYIEREYIGRHTNQIYIIKNKHLLFELERKLSRILAWEKVHKNSYRQHITTQKEYLLKELKQNP